MPIDEELSKLIHGDYEAFLDVVWKRDMDCRRATCSLMCLVKSIYRACPEERDNIRSTIQKAIAAMEKIDKN
jgi:hypothetical protein